VKLALVISSLAAGGAQRVLTTLAARFAEGGHEVSMLTLAGGTDSDFYPLPHGVKRAAVGDLDPSANVVAGIMANLRRIWSLYRALRRDGTEAVISFGDQSNVIAVLAARLARLPVIVSERIDPQEHDIGGRMWERLRAATYPLASTVVFQTAEVSRRFVAANPRVRPAVIPNPIPQSLVHAHAAPARSRQGPPRRIVGMGRLVPQKGFDLLLRAFARVARHRDEVELWIWGEGPDRDALANEIARLGLDGRVRLPGNSDSPWDVMAAADCFVLSSRYEGFPNVMLEAMAVGTPVIAFDCPSGPREISHDGADALLVPNGDVPALAEAMTRVLADAPLRERLALTGTSVRKRFCLARIVAQWEALLAQAQAERRNAR
jgi:glycosyltransferase involved in cell wall biosynthesis